MSYPNSVTANSATCLALAKAPTFLVVELLNPNDSLNFAAHLEKKLHYTNVTPRVKIDEAWQPHTTFKSSKAGWEAFREKLSKLAYRRADQKRKIAVPDPDVIYLSGHFSTSLHSQQAEAERIVFDGIGFFNEHYYVYEFSSNTSDHDDGIFFSCGRNSDFPLFKTVHTQTKVVILAGCNTLKYPAARKLMQSKFPNSIVIGFVGKDTAGVEFSDAVIAKLDRNFYAKASCLSDAELIEYCKELNREFQAKAKAAKVHHRKERQLWFYRCSTSTMFAPSGHAKTTSPQHLQQPTPEYQYSG